MGSFNYSDDYSSFDNLLDRTTLLTEGGRGLGGYHPSFGPLRADIEDVGGIGTYRARQFVVRLLYRYLEPPIITEEELDYIQKGPDGRARGAARPEYNTALTEVLDKHKDEIAQRADEIGDALEKNFPALANEILGVNPEKARMKIATRAAEKEIKQASKKIKQGEDPEDAVDDAVEEILSGPGLVQVFINKVLTDIQAELGEPGFDISEDALQQVIDYVDRIETIDQLKQFVDQITPLPDYQKIGAYLSTVVKPLRRHEKEQAAKSEDDEDPYAGVNDPGDPEDEEYSKNLEGGRTSIVDSLNNNMRKRKLLFEKKKKWGKFRSNRRQKLVVEKDLDAAERRALPDSDFALPGKGKGPEGKQAGSYPIPDESHARSALSLVSQHGTPEEKKKVRAAVARKYPDITQEEEEEKQYDATNVQLMKLIQNDIMNGMTAKESIEGLGVDPAYHKDLFRRYQKWADSWSEGPIEPESWFENEEARADLQRGPMLDSYQSDTSGYLSEQVTKDKRNKKPGVKNQSFKERYKPKTHWQLQELRRMGL